MTTNITLPATREENDDAAARINVSALEQQLLGRWGGARRIAREMVKDPALHKVEGLTVPEHRERVLGQMKMLVDEGAIKDAYPVEYGGKADHGGSIARFEELVAADPSLQIKAGVQWGLFGSAVLHLGTEEHHKKWLPGILSLEIPGAFAMTETGHGSDVASIATTATYDAATDEFVINTPFRGAWKDYLGNAALHGVAATVFAQLITKGVNHGVHAFYVDIRNPETGEFLEGIGGEDDGIKGGLNGIDNGRLHFTNVRVPRANLLNRYGDVDAEGTYTSPIASPGRRFFTMLGTLVQGRVSLDGAATNASKIALQIAVKYALERRQFNASSPTEEEVLMDYQRHQRRLIPLIAKTYAMGFAHEELLQKFDGVFSGREDTEETRQDLETLAAALKSLSTWNALDILQECREACGGSGFLIENRFASLRADLDVYVTFEGDNNILLQLVAKRLLGDYGRHLKELKGSDMAQYIANQAADAAFSRSGLRRLAQTVADTGSERKSAIALRDESAQRALLSDRVNQLVAEVAGELRGSHKLPQAKAAEIFNSNQDQLLNAAKAHAELLQWEAFTRAIHAMEDEGTRSVMTIVRDVFGLSLIEENLSWYLMSGRLSSQRARTLGEYINRLLLKLRPHVNDLVDAFGYDQDHRRAPISSGAEKKRQDEAAEYFRALRASADAPIDEKILHAKAKAPRS
jgi:acyl-CoA oxidase